MKRLLLLLAFTSTSAFAASRSMSAYGGTLTISPTVGFERVQKYYPTPHMSTRAVYGVNALYQFSVLGIEADYTHSQDDDYDVATDTKYKDSVDKLRAGLRGSFRAGNYLNWYLRGGAQATKTEITSTVQSTAVTNKKSTTKVNPYVGTGLTLRLLNAFSVSGDVVATYKPTDDPNLSDFEFQPTVSFNINF